MTVINREDGAVIAVTGSPRMGKTGWIVQQTKQHPRVLAWDVRGEYMDFGFERVSGPRALLERLKACRDGDARIAYVGQVQDFEVWAWAAMRWGMYDTCTVIGDELADVTRPGKAPASWGQLLRKGAGYGLHVYGSTARPAESDSTIWGCASLFHVHRLHRAADRDAMARELDCRPDEIAALQPLEYLERGLMDAQIRRGKLVF